MNQINIPKGKFIVIEGLDGSGKTLQSRLLVAKLKDLGYRVNLSFEPTYGPIGTIIRQALLGRISIDTKTIAALFAADRLDHLNNPVNGVLKHINQGIIEISDRYYLTSFAYQTLSVDEQWVWSINAQAIKPDLTLFLDVEPEECFSRIIKSQVDNEMFHNEDHFYKAREKYLEAINILKNKENIVIIDSNYSPEEVNFKIQSEVIKIL